MSLRLPLGRRKLSITKDLNAIWGNVYVAKKYTLNGFVRAQIKMDVVEKGFKRHLRSQQRSL